MRRDEGIIATLLILIGSMEVVPQLLGGGPWGAQATLAALLVALGVLAMVGELVRCGHHHDARVPRAR